MCGRFANRPLFFYSVLCILLKPYFTFCSQKKNKIYNNGEYNVIVERKKDIKIPNPIIQEEGDTNGTVKLHIEQNDSYCIQSQMK